MDKNSKFTATTNEMTGQAMEMLKRVSEEMIQATQFTTNQMFDACFGVMDNTVKMQDEARTYTNQALDQARTARHDAVRVLKDMANRSEEATKAMPSYDAIPATFRNNSETGYKKMQELYTAQLDTFLNWQDQAEQMYRTGLEQFYGARNEAIRTAREATNQARSNQGETLRKMNLAWQENVTTGVNAFEKTASEVTRQAETLQAKVEL